MNKLLFKNKYRITSTRLEGFDYSSDGMYFVTICVKGKLHYLGEIENDKMNLNKYGEIVKKCIIDLPNHYENCLIDKFIIMPNHIHLVVCIDNIGWAENDNNVSNGVETGFVRNVETGLKPVSTGTQKRYSLSEIIRGLKTFSSRQINEITTSEYGKFQWQSRFYDHIIRNDESLNKIRDYIDTNPLHWAKDKLNINKNI